MAVLARSIEYVALRRGSLGRVRAVDRAQRVGRFLVEEVRINREVLWAIYSPQLWSLVLVAIGVSLLMVEPRRVDEVVSLWQYIGDAAKTGSAEPGREPASSSVAR